MIRRTFNYTEHDGEARDVQLLVTYDADTDTMHVGTRVADYDTWSTPLTLVSSDDDPVGRTGGPGSVRGVTVEGGLLGRLINLVEEYTTGTTIQTPDVVQTADPTDYADSALPTQVAAVPNQTRSPQPDTTAMQEDPRRDRRGS